MDPASEKATPKKRLALKRETVRNLNDPILTTQGWSLWTCEETADLGPREGEGEQGR
ncbi:hypothetical protein [Sphaerisporangium dianthi]|uniref:Uncharacterized protein n=1 Tax=Sphaerisporangium dianthi TaxID=1436120 RepID=A0ABV9CI75_9ACTN